MWVIFSYEQPLSRTYMLQEIPCSLWNPKVHYCLHMTLPMVPACSQMNSHYTPSNWLTDWLHGAESFLEKLTSSQLVKKFPAFYGTQRFITAFIRAHHLSVSWARSIQSMPPPHFLKIHFNIIPHLCLGSPSDLFPPDFPTKTLYALLLAPSTCPAHLILLDLITQIIFGEE